MISSAQPFGFHNGFWTNLHYFLLQQSIETTDGDSLSAVGKAAWTQAVHFYQLRFAGRDRLRPGNGSNQELH
jgi:hypothetical protein